MEFKKFSAGMHSYGTTSHNFEIPKESGLTNVNFYDKEFNKAVEEGGERLEYLKRFVEILALCHTVIVEDKKG